MGLAFPHAAAHNGSMRNRSSNNPEDVTPTPADAAPAEPTTEQPPAEPGKNPAAVALGRLGGKKGGPARAAKLSKKKRSEIAKRAAQARWERRTAERKNA